MMKFAHSKLIALTLFLFASLASSARAGLAEDAAEATVDIYNRMNAKDSAGFLKYRPVDGFTEFTPGSKALDNLDYKVFVDYFKSDRQIKLRATDVKAKLIGDVALVTATRSGYVAPAGVAAPVDVSYGLTMIWTRINGELKLLHLHYSPLAK